MQAAIDFAVLRMQCGVGGVERNVARYSAWQALHLNLTFSRLLGTNPAYHIATHHAAFSTRAFCKCKLQLILRRGGCGREVAKLECVECPAYHLAAHSANVLATAFCESAIDFAEAAEGGGVAGFAPKL